jgi:hypothetical protein
MQTKKILDYFHYCTIVIIALLNSAGAVNSVSDTSRQQFFDTLETRLRDDYLLCTDDSSTLTLNELMAWKRSIDSVVSRIDYAAVMKDFSKETGIKLSDARPCEVVAWMKRVEEQNKTTTQLLSDERDKRIRWHNDSLYIAHELISIPQKKYDLAGLPFGLSQRGFLILAQRNGVPSLIDDGAVLRCDSFSVGMMQFKAAFHFTKGKKYWCYELESRTCGIDSLDQVARAIVDYLATHLEVAASQPPDHIYRVGMLDIVPGRLSICKIWNLLDATAYVGLARTGNRFYAKMIVKSKKIR